MGILINSLKFQKKRVYILTEPCKKYLKQCNAKAIKRKNAVLRSPFHSFPLSHRLKRHVHFLSSVSEKIPQLTQTELIFTLQ